MGGFTACKTEPKAYNLNIVRYFEFLFSPLILPKRLLAVCSAPPSRLVCTLGTQLRSCGRFLSKSFGCASQAGRASNGGVNVTSEQSFLQQWMGRQERQHDVLVPTPLNALAATLDRPDAAYLAGAKVPPLWHWLYFLPLARQSVIGADGHPERGGFLPPVTLPRRMWAGGRLSFYSALPVGAEVLRTSTILDVSQKSGRSGELVFVKLCHELAVAGEVVVREEQDIVYRDHPQPEEAPAAPQPAPRDAHWVRSVTPDPVLLFRFSALTFNGHRIHYDRPYAQQEEGYPGLVVQGPLIATLLMNLLRDQRPHVEIAAFSFRAVRPLFDLRPFNVCGRVNEDASVQLWAEDADGFLCMDARAELA